MLIPPLFSFTMVSRKLICVLEDCHEFGSHMYSVEIFDKLIQLCFPVLQYIEDIIYVAIPYQWLEMVTLYIFVFELLMKMLA